MKSSLEDAEERNDYYKRRIKKAESMQFGMIPVMTNPYDYTQNHATKEDTKEPEDQSSGKRKLAHNLLFS